MTAVPLQAAHDYSGRPSPVSHTAAGPRRVQARLTEAAITLGGRLTQGYAVYESGRLIGTIFAPNGRPEFGMAKPTVLLKRGEEGKGKREG